MAQQALATVQIDDAHFRVTEWTFAPGTETGWHTHQLDYVVVPMTTGSLVLHTRDAETPFDLVAGRTYTRPAGAEHNVRNPGTATVTFIEVEAKAR
jgi:beta-alanine degradation protein BauB